MRLADKTQHVCGYAEGDRTGELEAEAAPAEAARRREQQLSASGDVGRGSLALQQGILMFAVVYSKGMGFRACSFVAAVISEKKMRFGRDGG